MEVRRPVGNAFLNFCMCIAPPTLLLLDRVHMKVCLDIDVTNVKPDKWRRGSILEHGTKQLCQMWKQPIWPLNSCLFFSSLVLQILLDQHQQSEWLYQKCMKTKLMAQIQYENNDFTLFVFPEQMSYLWAEKRADRASLFNTTLDFGLIATI